MFRWNNRNTEQAEQRGDVIQIMKQNRSELAPELDRKCDLKQEQPNNGNLAKWTQKGGKLFAVPIFLKCTTLLSDRTKIVFPAG